MSAICLLVGLGCRAEPGANETLSFLQANAGGESSASFVVGHRFGGWLEVDPTHECKAALEKACLLEQRGAIEEAIETLSDAADDRPRSPALFQARGALYVHEGFPRAAAGDFQRAVALAADSPRAWYALGHAYEILDLSHQALEALTHALSLGLDTGELHTSLARAHRSLKRRGRAARHYELALSRQEQAPTELLVEAAMLACEDRDHAKDLESLSEALEVRQETKLSENAWFLRAFLRESPGEPAEGVASYLQALEVDPAELASLTATVLNAVQLIDPETRAETATRLLAQQSDPNQRALLERRIGEL